MKFVYCIAALLAYADKRRKICFELQNKYLSSLALLISVHLSTTNWQVALSWQIVASTLELFWWTFKVDRYVKL